MENNPDILIIGGGVIGCAMAEALALEGLSVTVVERGQICRESSWAAAGMVAPQSEMEKPGPYFDFCLESRRLLPETIERLRERSFIDPQYRDAGMLYAAFDEATERMLLDRVAWQRKEGVDAPVLSRDEALALEPALSGDIRMAVHFQEDHQLDPRLLTQAYIESAKRAGARVLEHCPVLGLIREGDRVVGAELPHRKIHAGQIVLAAGAWSGLMAGLERGIPTHPVKGQMLALQMDGPAFSHTLHSPEIYVVPRLDGRVVIGSTQEPEAGFDKTVRAGVVARLLEDAWRIAPALRDAEWVEAWAGLRPATPDLRAVIGKSDLEGLWLATGHYRNGVMLAPLTAKRLTQYMLTDVMPETLRHFSFERFHQTKNKNANATNV